MLLTRAPLYSWYCYHFLVRLACVRHAASVDSEPGSNSRLKPDASPPPTEVGEVQRHRTLENARCNYVRMIKPNLIYSHNWHVQPNCQRSLRAIRLSGALWDRGPAVTPGCPRTCCAHQLRVLQRSLAFLREPFKDIEDPLPCQAFNFHSPEAPIQYDLGGAPHANFDQPDRNQSPVQKRRAAQNIKHQPN